MNSSKIRTLVFSDVHLYHDKTKTEHIVNGLRRALGDNESLRDVDMIIISGDLFDHEVFMPNPDAYHVISFVYHLLEMCVKYDIVLRVLEGTPSHDWRQSKIIIDINDHLTTPADVRHVTTLSIEHIERFGIDILYVPDEWGNGCASTYVEVRELLAQHNLDKVDLAIMHGCFTYQFPVNLVGKPDVHDEISYLEITRYVVVIGHYHTHSVFERIYVPGSFDRLKHGEEEAKGYLDILLNQDGTFDVKFIENPSAMIYKTFDFTGCATADVVTTLKQYLGDSLDECFIRILADKEDPVYSGIKELKFIFPHVKFSISLKNKIKDKLVSETEQIVRPSSLSTLNIVELMQERLMTKYPEVAEDCIATLRSIMND